MDQTKNTRCLDLPRLTRDNYHSGPGAAATWPPYLGLYPDRAEQRTPTLSTLVDHSNRILVKMQT